MQVGHKVNIEKSFKRRKGGKKIMVTDHEHTNRCFLILIKSLKCIGHMSPQELAGLEVDLIHNINVNPLVGM